MQYMAKTSVMFAAYIKYNVLCNAYKIIDCTLYSEYYR